MALIELNRNSRELIEKLHQDKLSYEQEIETLNERFAELELALEDRDWQKLDGQDGKEFSRNYQQTINHWARLMWTKNPLIKRAVYTQTSYVFGQGINIEAEDERVNEVIQEFLNDKKNRTELTEHQARMTKETELQLFGNLFFVFFVNKATGQVRVRTLPSNEITDVITNPDDAKEPWYYRRDYVEQEFLDKWGTRRSKHKTVYYPDWRVDNPRKFVGGQPVEDAFVYHVSVNKLSDQKFGTSEVYSALDWAKAYNHFLEDWATIVRAHSKFAWRIVTKGQGKAGIKKAKDKLHSNYAEGGTKETNPAPPAGGTWISSGNERLEPIKTSGAQAKAEDGDRMIHMVSAGTGIFYHYLVGDPSTGNLATAKSMERPMEIQFKDRQALWKSIYTEILNFVIFKAVEAPTGKLKNLADIAKNAWGEKYIKWRKDLQNEDPEMRDKKISGTVYVSFPDLLEKDVNNQIDAIVKASTMGGRPSMGMIEQKDISRLLMTALGMSDVDEKLEKMYPEDEEPEDDDEPAAIIRNAAKKMQDSLQKWLEYENENGKTAGDNGRISGAKPDGSEGAEIKEN